MQVRNVDRFFQSKIGDGLFLFSASAIMTHEILSGSVDSLHITTQAIVDLIDERLRSRGYDNDLAGYAAAAVNFFGGKLRAITNSTFIRKEETEMAPSVSHDMGLD